MKHNLIFLIAIMAFFPTHLFSQDSGTLSFQVTGFADNAGQLLVQLFRKDDKVPAKPFKQIKAKIMDKRAEVNIDLPFGDYAAIFVHDRNGNDKIDHRLGIPNEPLGYTNNWKLSLFSGMPTFEKLRFTFSASMNHFVIKMPE